MRLFNFVSGASLVVGALGHGGVYNYSIGDVSYAGLVNNQFRCSGFI